MENKQVVIYINGIERSVNQGVYVSEILQEMSDFRMPCAGHGRCGKCKVWAKGVLSELKEKERNYLTKQELENGIRLACQTKVLGLCKISSIQEGTIEVLLNKETMQHTFIVENTKPMFKKLGVAVDIGTTTLAVSLYDKHGLAGQMGTINPQVAFGADVISRIEHSLYGKGEQLAKAVQHGIVDLLEQLCGMYGYRAEEIDTLVITGNTVMLYLLMKKNPKSLSYAPFQADWLADEWVEASHLELGCPSAKVYLPCCISAFIGADITMALLHTNICRDRKKRLLVDIGTNGEVVLWTGEKLLCCSTAAGPAFEGTGLVMGMTASAGAISKVFFEDGTFKVQVIGNQEPIGICGSGVIDAVSCLLQSERMDETGYLEEEEIILSGTVKITQEDIRKIQLAKSAICAGIEAVLHQEGISTKDLEELLIAGGFGSKIDLENAIRIGLLPQMDVKKIKICGNSSLAGAEMLLHNCELLEKQKELIQISQSFDLATDSFFQEKYIEGMFFLARKEW